jgi:hypothetical protein
VRNATGIGKVTRYVQNVLGHSEKSGISKSKIGTGPHIPRAMPWVFSSGLVHLRTKRRSWGGPGFGQIWSPVVGPAGAWSTPGHISRPPDLRSASRLTQSLSHIRAASARARAGARGAGGCRGNFLGTGGRPGARNGNSRDRRPPAPPDPSGHPAAPARSHARARDRTTAGGPRRGFSKSPRPGHPPPQASGRGGRRRRGAVREPKPRFAPDSARSTEETESKFGKIRWFLGRGARFRMAARRGTKKYTLPIQILWAGTPTCPHTRCGHKTWPDHLGGYMRGREARVGLGKTSSHNVALGMGGPVGG